MNVNNFENHLDQQEKNSHLNNSSLKATIASVLLSASASAEMNGTSTYQELVKKYENERVQNSSDKNEAKKAVLANYMEIVSKYRNKILQLNWEPVKTDWESVKLDWGPVELKGTEKQAVVDEFKTSFHINGDSLNISKVIVDDPKIFDLIAKKYIGESQRTANGKYAYVQDYFLDATMNPNKDQKYADKLKTVDMDLLVQKVMKDNRHELKLNKFWVNSEKYNVGLTESGNKMLFNNLLVFDVKGATAIEERIKSVEVNYDRNATKERLESEISKLPFKLNFDREVLKNMPDYMDHIDLARLLQTSIKWSSQTKLENATNEKDDLKNWSRALVVNGATTKELTDVAVKFNDDKVAIEIQEPKDFKAKLFGFDLEFKCKVKNGKTGKNGGLEVEIPTKGDNGLEKFKEHFVKSFKEIWEKTNKTHLGDQNVFQNLNKVPYKVGNIMQTTVSPRIITADPSTGFEINVTSRVDPVIIRNVIENSQDGKPADMKFIDEPGRTLAGNRIQHGKNSSISLGDKEGGYKLEELRGAEQPYTYISFWWSLGSKLANTIKSFNSEKSEIVCRDKRGHKEISRIPVKVEDQDASPKVKKEVGYFYDQERNPVEVTADNFSYLLSQASNREQSLMVKGIRLWLSDTQIHEKFRELFNEAYWIGGWWDGKMTVGLKGLIVEGRYATVDVKEKGKHIDVNENVPEKVLKIIREMEAYLAWVDKLNQMQVMVSPEGKAKQSKSRNLFESIGGEHGVGRTPVIAWTIKDGKADEKQSDALQAFGSDAKYVVIDGRGEKIPVEFDVSTGTPSLKNDKIEIDKVTYDLSYDRSDNTLYLLPQKVK